MISAYPSKLFDVSSTKQFSSGLQSGCSRKDFMNWIETSFSVPFNPLTKL